VVGVIGCVISNTKRHRWFGQAFGESPSEDELIAHFIVPFSRALGWVPERTPAGVEREASVDRFGAAVTAAGQQFRRAATAW
jgi:hypothetical protein